ncbi:hypothetical protein [Thalassomonas sp. M1454]|uniref:hypothetical protein n=1 Tax=Thalassomonas sp. M1454 TaxID=2594477 RepID=UPI00117D8BA7|nr:hypothetical protein [Thalassomonas sp. M1454]TRX52806.1 hypothetical protein FNN08_15725 [Thalassomonas sp. M1454]
MSSNNVPQIKGLLIVGIITILMTTFWLYFKKNEDDLVKTAMASAAAAFTSKVTLIHSQWLMTGKPNKVLIKARKPGSNDSFEQLTFKVNKYGWPDLTIAHNACARIWERITESELKVLNAPLIAIELNSKDKNRVCRYQLSDKKYIEYNSATGKIINKN